MTRFAQLLLVLTSVAPIVFVYAMSVVVTETKLGVLLLGVVVVFSGACAGMLRLAKVRPEHERREVSLVTGLEKEPLAFLVAYALPVVTAAAKPTDAAGALPGTLALAAFLAVMALLVWQQQLFYVNPVAAMLGYHFHSAKCPDGPDGKVMSNVLIVSKRKTLASGIVTVAVLSNYLWLDVD